MQYLLLYRVVRRISRRHGTGRVADDLGWRVGRRDVWPGIGTAALALVGTVVAGALLRAVLDFPVGDETQFGSLDDTSAARLVLAVAAVLGAPFLEELLFRGVILHALLRWGWPTVIAGSSLLFGLIHLNAELTLRHNMLIVGSTAATGAILAWVVLRTDRLGPAIVAHTGFNALVIWAVFSA